MSDDTCLVISELYVFIYPWLMWNISCFIRTHFVQFGLVSTVLFFSSVIQVGVESWCRFNGKLFPFHFNQDVGKFLDFLQLEWNRTRWESRFAILHLKAPIGQRYRWLLKVLNHFSGRLCEVKFCQSSDFLLLFDSSKCAKIGIKLK